MCIYYKGRLLIFSYLVKNLGVRDKGNGYALGLEICSNNYSLNQEKKSIIYRSIEIKLI